MFVLWRRRVGEIHNYDVKLGTRASQGWGWAPQGWGTKVGFSGLGEKSGASQKKGLSGLATVGDEDEGAPGFTSRAARPSDPAGRL